MYITEVLYDKSLTILDCLEEMFDNQLLGLGLGYGKRQPQDVELLYDLYIGQSCLSILTIRRLIKPYLKSIELSLRSTMPPRDRVEVREGIYERACG